MKNLEALWKKGKDFLGVESPIISGGMSWVSNFELVKAISEAGGFPVLAGGNMPPEIFEKEVDRCLNEIEGPFAVNMVTIAPYFPQQNEIIRRKKVPFVVFAGNFPKKGDVQAVKEMGVKTMAFASSLATAKQMIRFGIDALILEGFEAGGHIGHVSLNILIQEILFNLDSDIPVFVAGGIGSGKMIPHLLMMGASGVQLGTKFVLSEECTAHPDFKKAFLKAKSRDAHATPQFDRRLPVVPVRAIKNKGHESFNELQLELMKDLSNGKVTMEEAALKVEGFWMGALRQGVQDGDLDNGSLMAGQSVGLCTEVKPMKDIFAELKNDAEEELSKIQKILA